MDNCQDTAKRVKVMQREREKARRRGRIEGFLACSLIVLFIFLASCSVEPRFAYYCPYPPEDLKDTAQRYQDVVYLSYWDLQSKYKGPERVRAFFYGGIIYIDESLPKASKEIAYNHEVCHPYEIEIGISARDTATHKGWLTKRL